MGHAAHGSPGIAGWQLPVGPSQQPRAGAAGRRIAGQLRLKRRAWAAYDWGSIAWSGRAWADSLGTRPRVGEQLSSQIKKSSGVTSALTALADPCHGRAHGSQGDIDKEGSCVRRTTAMGHMLHQRDVTKSKPACNGTCTRGTKHWSAPTSMASTTPVRRCPASCAHAPCLTACERQGWGPATLAVLRLAGCKTAA